MEEKELLEILKDRLKLDLKRETPAYGCDGSYTVQPLLDGQVISEVTMDTFDGDKDYM